MKKTVLAALGISLALSSAPLLAGVPVRAARRGVRPAASHWRGGHWGGGHFRGHWGFRRGWWGPRYGFGWGWGWGSWYTPYYWGYYPGAYYGAGPGYGFAVIDTDVSPDEARVYLDGRYIGIADDFDGFPDYLYLGRGHYRIEFRLEGYETKVVELDARPGRKLDIDDKLKKIPGSKQYGSYDTPELKGGVQRFFAKKSDGGDEAATPDAGYGAPPEGRSQENSEDQAPPSGAVEPAPPERGATPSQPWRDRPGGAESGPARPGDVRPTRLAIRAVPMDAAVYVDDRFVGTAEEMAGQPRGLRVSPGRHTVTVSRPGYKERTVEVEVESGQTEPVEIELER